MKHIKKLLALLLCAVMMIGVFPTAAFSADSAGLENFKKANTFGDGLFADVTPEDWYYENVKAAYEFGLMVGQGNGFGADSAVTVAETVTLAARLYSIYSGDHEQFVQRTPWYAVYADYVSRKGLISLSGLDMNAPATRAQFARILGAALPDAALESISFIADDAIPDVKAGDDCASAVYRLYRAGVLTGNDDKGTFTPGADIKRSEVAAIVTRMADPSLRKAIKLGDGYVVKFDLNYDNAVNQFVYVQAGQAVNTPADPVRKDYSFDGWYTARFAGEKYVFGSGITSDTTIYAHWTYSYYGNRSTGAWTPGPTVEPEFSPFFTVTFESNGGSAVAPQTVPSGGTATMPDAPIRDSFIFNGWYIDSKLTEIYDFSLPITSDIILYAGWTSHSDNLADDIIDYGDITEMMSTGRIEVIFDENGRIRTIDGRFTDKKIRSKEDAAEVLNSASSLFVWTDDDFYVKASDIVTQSTEGGANQLREIIYRYSPTVNSIPVLGSQIIISTDDNGNATGLFCTYNEKILKVDTVYTINADTAVSVAINTLLDTEIIQNAMETYLQKNNDAKEAALKQELSDTLLSNADVSLIIYAVSDSENPALVYEVTLSDTVIDNSIDITDGNVEVPANADSPIELGEPDAFDSNSVDVDVMLTINCTCYVCANGESAGEIYSIISNNIGWTSYYFTAPDLKNVRRTFIGQEQDGVYRLVDSVRNIETRKATEKTEGHLWWKTKTYSLPGDIVQSSFNALGLHFLDESAVSAHANMEAVYDYYLNTLGRRSYDGYGAKITNTVGYYYDDALLYDTPQNFKNACWTGGVGGLYQFVFGLGKFEAALDVVGHEFTHAVISCVVVDSGYRGLFYEDESGALNEAYADIMGCLIEGKTEKNKWLLAEDSSNAIRSLASPSSYNQPEHYNNRYTGTYDNGGVHKNSGIFNFAAYKMMTDSRTNGVDDATWARVFYQSLYRLATNATFLDARGAIIASAKALGFSETQQQAIKDAFDAVGIVEPDSIRIVLRWGAYPSDLDSHLVGPGVKGDRFHTAYYQRNYYTDGTYEDNGSYGSKKYAVDLDYDDTTSYGPEVTTIHTLTPGEYYFFVHDYSNRSSETSTEMAHSGATVRVYRGSSGTPIDGGSFSVNTDSSGTIWNVFKLTIGTDKSISIEPINTYGTTETYS